MRRALVLFVLVVLSLGNLEKDLIQFQKDADAKEEARLADLNKLVLPFDEAGVREHYGIDEDDEFPVDVQRVSDVSKEDAAKLMERGVPFVVSDGLRDWDLAKWTCDSVQREFPNEEVSGWASYMNHEPVVKLLKDLALEKEQPAQERATLDVSKDDAEAPTTQAWLWYPVQPGVPPLNDTVVQKLKPVIPELPYFAQNTTANRKAFSARFQMFLGGASSGLDAHVDHLCVFIMSAQIEGSKLWRLTLPPDVAALSRLNPSFTTRPGDGTVLHQRMLRQHAIWKTVLQPGEVLVLPPGLVHGTRVPANSRSLSLSKQLSTPPPIRYLQRFQNHLLGYDGCGPCWEQGWNAWLYGDAMGPLWNGGCASLFRRLDRNSDGKLEVKELIRPLGEEGAHAFVALHDDSNQSFVDRRQHAVQCRRWKQHHQQLSDAPDRVAGRKAAMMKSLLKCFHRVAGDRNVLDRATWQKALSPNQADVAWKVVESTLDHDGDQAINTEELIDLVQGDLNDPEEHAEDVEPVLQPALALLLTGDLHQLHTCMPSMDQEEFPDDDDDDDDQHFYNQNSEL